MSADDGPGTREVAQRLFAAEFEDADFEYSESDEERAPNYVVTPTGARVNRMFVVGVLTEVETVNENTLRGRVVDPTGAFVSYAGQYQPDEMAFLDRTRPPAFVALTGKARTFQPDDSDVVYTSVRPERFAEVDDATRDRWTVSTAEATLRRVAVMRDALAMDARGEDLRRRLEAAGVRPALAAGVPLAIDHYDTGERYLEAVRRLAVQALEVVADERDEVASLDAAPGERGSVSLGPLPAGVEGVDAASVSDETSVAGETSEAAETSAGDELDEFDTGDVADAFDPDEGGTAESATAESATTDGETQTDGPATTETTATTDEAGTTSETADETDREPATATAGGESESPTATTGFTSERSESSATTETSESSATTETSESSATTETSESEFDTTTGEQASEPETDFGTDDTLGSGDETTDPGSFDADGFDTDDTDAPTDAGTAEADDELGSFDPEEDDALTEEEREEVEEEFGVGFSSGSEVPDPEESELDAPDPEEITPDPEATGADPADEAATSDTAAPADTASAADTTDASDTARSPTDEAGDAEAADDGGSDAADDATDVDVTTAVVEIMGELDEGDGADREKVKAAAIQRHGATPEEADEAIQDALMNGQCYEAGDGLKPI